MQKIRFIISMFLICSSTNLFAADNFNDDLESKAQVPDPKKCSSVKKHINYFLGEDGLLTRGCMRGKHIGLGVNDDFWLTGKIAAIEDMGERATGLEEDVLDDNGLSTIAERLQYLDNPSSAGFWRSVDGMVDMEVLDGFTDGKVNISKKDVNDHLAVLRDAPGYKKKEMAKIDLPLCVKYSIDSEKVTKGSVGELFFLFGENDSMSVEDFRLFYTDNDKFMEKFHNKKKTPVSRKRKCRKEQEENVFPPTAY